MQTVIFLLVVSTCSRLAADGRSPRGPKAEPVTSVIKLPNGYELECRRDSGDASREGPARYRSLTIRRAGRAIEKLGGEREPFLEGYRLPALTRTEPQLKTVDQDINADGVPDLVIREYTGGAHCCTVDHVFSVGKDSLRHIRLEHGHGDPDLPGGRFLQADDDPALEVRSFDWTFADWRLPFALSPAPEIILDYQPEGGDTRGEYRVLLRKEKLAKSRWESMLDNARTLQRIERGAPALTALATLLADVLDLLYSGNAPAAREYLAVAFAGRDRERLVFTIDFAVRLSTSPYVEDILRLNEVDTIGELLAGEEAAPPTETRSSSRPSE